jgi:acyl dehydratase
MSKLNLEVIGDVVQSSREYSWKDVILYALGIGAQTNELAFIYERNPGGLKTFPSFATIIADGGAQLGRIGAIDGSRFIHGEQTIVIHKPFPIFTLDSLNSAPIKITRKGMITNIYDKGKGAVIQSQVSCYNEQNELIIDSKRSHFYIGEGGWGGDPGPKTPKMTPPDSQPDFSISYKTMENQAAIYRLSGDYNPLHIDPEFARRGGQTKPILHGLGTYGFSFRAILYGLSDGDISQFKEYKARFASVVYPGEVLTTEGWKTEENGKYIIQVRTENAVVVSNAYAIIK